MVGRKQRMSALHCEVRSNLISLATIASKATQFRNDDYYANFIALTIAIGRNNL